MGKNLAVFWDSCFSLHSFWVEMQKSTKGIYDRFEVQVVTVWSSRLGKNKILPFLLMVDCLRTFKITRFLSFLKDF